MESIYLDTNASAAVHPEVLDLYLQVTRDAPANPASLHRAGRRAQGILEDARERVARVMQCSAREVVFTSGATESNNLALLGAARALARLSGNLPALVASRAEHPSVLGPLRLLQQDGYPLHLAGIDAHARVVAEELLALVPVQGQALVALQWANNETGVVQPVQAIHDALPDRAHLHVDAAQGVGKLPWCAGLDRADTLAVSGHKFRAPKGIGVLRVREAAFLEPVMGGGGQQRGVRPGTENVPAAAALALAMELAEREQAEFAADTSAACASLLETIRPLCPEMRCNHPADQSMRLPNTLSLTFPGIDGRTLLPACDVEGLAVSSGAACSSGAAQPSSLLLAAGLDEDDARGTLRITFGWKQNERTGVRTAERLARVLKRLYKHAKR